MNLEDDGTARKKWMQAPTPIRPFDDVRVSAPLYKLLCADPRSQPRPPTFRPRGTENPYSAGISNARSRTSNAVASRTLVGTISNTAKRPRMERYSDVSDARAATTTGIDEHEHPISRALAVRPREDVFETDPVETFPDDDRNAIPHGVVRNRTRAFADIPHPSTLPKRSFLSTGVKNKMKGVRLANLNSLCVLIGTFRKRRQIKSARSSTLDLQRHRRLCSLIR